MCNRITRADVVRKGGYSILSQYYQGDLRKALQDLYPHHDWLMWRFTRVPPKWWASKENQKIYIEWIGKQLGVQQLDDWYKIKVHEFNNRDGEGNYYLGE